MPRPFLFLFGLTSGLLALAAVAVTSGSLTLAILAGVPALVCVAVLVWVVYLDGRREREMTRVARDLRRKL